MGKGKQLTQKDIMIWVGNRPSGVKTYYLIEKEPFEKEGIRKAVWWPGSTHDAVFRFREQAEEILARFPAGDEAEAETGSAAEAEAGSAAEAEAGATADAEAE